MSNKITAEDAKAHIPQLVMNQNVHKQIHGDNIVGLINSFKKCTQMTHRLS